MTTNNIVNVGLSGSTGTGNFVGATSPTLITPALGTPASGNLASCTGYHGALIAVQTFTGASGTYTPTSGMATVIFEMQGDGGGSGAVTGTTNTKSGAGSGGGGGGFLQISATSANVGASCAYTVGQGGTAGTTVPAVPGAGTGTTLTINSLVFTAAGGSAGANSAAATGTNNTSGGGYYFKYHPIQRYCPKKYWWLRRRKWPFLNFSLCYCRFRWNFDTRQWWEWSSFCSRLKCRRSGGNGIWRRSCRCLV